MLVVGSGGHAKEIMNVLQEDDNKKKLSFFNNIEVNKTKRFFDFPILNTFQNVEELFEIDNRYCLGLGGPENRFRLKKLFESLGGNLISVISNNSDISFHSNIGKGVNIMPYATINNDVYIGEGVLINSHVSIHHDAKVGQFSEISPGARILGGCNIGEFCFIGANAVVLPGLTIKNKIKIGAGAVVTKNLTEEGTYIGVPAKKLM